MSQMREKPDSVTWLLFAVWIFLNLADVAISLVVVRLGASEVGALWWVTRNWFWLTVTKMMLALLIGWLLVYFKKTTWLVVLNVGMAGVCAYNCWVLLQQTGN